MSVISESQQRAINYAKHYPLVQSDSRFMGPVSVGNLGEFDGRVIINLCLRTAKSAPKNASISFPRDWAKATRFRPGDQVCVQIENGFVKNIWPAQPEPVKAYKGASVVTDSEKVADQTDNPNETSPAETQGEVKPY